MSPAASLVNGPTNIPLWHKTIGAILHEQVESNGNKTALIIPWQNVRCSFRDLQTRSGRTAGALLATGIKQGEMIACMAGNRVEYIDFVLAAARIGCPLTVLNNTYTPSELSTALGQTGQSIHRT